MKIYQALKEGDEALEIYSRTPRGSVLVHEDALRALLAVTKAAVEYDALVQEWLAMAPLQTGRTGVAIRMDAARERLHELIAGAA